MYLPFGKHWTGCKGPGGEEVTPRAHNQRGTCAGTHISIMGVQVQELCDVRFMGPKEGMARSI